MLYGGLSLICGAQYTTAMDGCIILQSLAIQHVSRAHAKWSANEEHVWVSWFMNMIEMSTYEIYYARTVGVLTCHASIIIWAKLFSCEFSQWVRRFTNISSPLYPLRRRSAFMEAHYLNSLCEKLEGDRKVPVLHFFVLIFEQAVSSY